MTTIDFSAMKPGDVVPLAGHEWELGPQQDYERAQEYATSTDGVVQFQVDSAWVANDRGTQSLAFSLKRIK